MVAGEPSPCSTVGKGQTGEFTKSVCQIGVLLANRKVSITLICLLLSKRRKRTKSVFPFNAHEKHENPFSFLLKVSMNLKMFLCARMMVHGSLGVWVKNSCCRTARKVALSM